MPRKPKQPAEQKLTLDDLGFYHPGEMDIYRYFNGTGIIKADPLTLYKKVISKADELDANIKALNFPTYSGTTECHNDLISDLRLIFNVKPVEEGGLTESAVEGLLTHFLDYCETVKKNWSIIPIPSKATSVSTPSTTVTPAEAASPPIQNILASGSIDNESSINVQNQQPSAPDLPLAQSTQAWSIGEIPQGKNKLEADKPNTEQPLAKDKK